MKLLTRKTVIAQAPKRWAEQYEGTHMPDKVAKTNRLKALPEGFSAEDVKEIVGNDSWTEIECDECEKKVEAVIIIEGFKQSFYVCADCLETALSTVRGTDQ